MINGKPGISSYDMFSIGRAIRTDLKTMGGNLLGLNSVIMKLSNGDDDSRAHLDPTIGARTVHKVSGRQIGKTVSSNSGGVGPMSTPARTANILGNPYMRRYEGPTANGSYNFGMQGAPSIGEYYDVYESEENRLRFLDDTIGRDLFGYTHLENAAIERSEDAINDEIYLKSTYNIFSDLENPFDADSVESFRLGSKRYSPTEPYALAPLESELVRRTLNGDVQGFKDKFEAYMPGRDPYTGSLIDVWDFMGSHYYLNLLNGIAEHGLFVENYEYQQRNRVAVYDRDAIPQSDYAYFLDVDTISPDKEIKGLLGKTNRLFYEGKIKSLANRFATLTANGEGIPGFLNTATDHMYGLSRGRNLRKLDLTQENGYPNPYCRVWTTHYQYSKYKNLIRGKWKGDDVNSNVNHYTLHKEDQLMRPSKGYERLKNMGSIDPENGRPIFTPYYVNDRSEMEKDSIKRCMFSIENLAWKDIIPDTTLIRKDPNQKSLASGESIVNYSVSPDTEGQIKTSYQLFNATGFGMTLTKEQRGPNGGRIMWFPPYNLKFSEQIHTNWSDNDFIGRGEKIYSYVNTERTGTLSFSILIDHPSIINEWARGGKMGNTGNKVSPLSKDEMILRYFAGCDSLQFNPRKEYDVPFCAVTKTSESIRKYKQKIPPVTEKKDVGRTTTDWEPGSGNTITFYSIFYYPNNYSAADFMGQKVSSAVYNGTLKNIMSKDQQTIDFTAGLNEMFETGQRETGTGYELGQGASENNTGMTYYGADKPYDVAKSKKGETISWYYPVDTRVNNEDLRGKTRYKDMKDFGLNGPKNKNCRSIYGTFWSDIPEQGEIINYLNDGNTDINEESDKFKAATEMVGVGGTEGKYFIPAYNFFKNLKDVITKLNAETKNKTKYEINIKGYASSQGYSSVEDVRFKVDIDKGEYESVGDVKSNDILAENRAAVIEGWIKSLKCFDFGGRDSISHNGFGEIQSTSTETESDFKPKAARAAVVSLSITPAKSVITHIQEYEDITISEEREEEREEKKSTTSIDEIYDTSKSDAYENQTYDDEYTYFKQINENDDMVKRYISDKVDYFDPAFHSITPEGFNARLTFLQQCTRQGPTISVSDTRTGSKFGAGNLSFGRAPFCVLRIGDFFNTKICIQNINIEYDNGGMHWDMNQEGIGLQPMMANVNMTFTFLGGNDISGPIARLQNAASFNYYANTSVYDRRSDYREGFVTQEDDTAHSWSPLLLNKNEKANVVEHKDFSTRSTLNKDDKNNK